MKRAPAPDHCANAYSSTRASSARRYTELPPGNPDANLPNARPPQPVPGLATTLKRKPSSQPMHPVSVSCQSRQVPACCRSVLDRHAVKSVTTLAKHHRRQKVLCTFIENHLPFDRLHPQRKFEHLEQFAAPGACGQYYLTCTHLALSSPAPCNAQRAGCCR